MEARKESAWGDLMRQAQDGDAQAYQKLLQELLPVVRAFCFKKVGFLGIAEDAAQEGILAIHNARHTYDPARPFKAWMFAIVRYKIIDLIRKRKNVAEKEFYVENAVEQAAGGEVFDGGVENSDFLGAALSALDEDKREAIELTKIQGLSIKEAAVRANITESAMKVRVHRAVKELIKKVKVDLNE